MPTHGQAGQNRTRTYRAWEAMKRRCTATNYIRYPDWGGRGIDFAAAWADFNNFYRDMGACPSGDTLDRINNDIGYSKENCKWSSYSQQNLNRRMPKSNKSGVLGVSWITTANRWQATGKLNCKSTNLYSGVDFFQAVCARKTWENKIKVAI